VSLDPPLVLWSLATTANSMAIFTGNSHYVINVLSADQAHLAKQFATRGIDPWENTEYELSRTGQPILKGASAWFECHNRSRYPEGDHVIFRRRGRAMRVFPLPAADFPQRPVRQPGLKTEIGVAI
jgi:Conserved protein/domain typically associated with flavoprotein oxygenases, DIM6/NTAB family